MSTLCTYENYLRDRYVLGQSVHYAAGSNSPKPKSYDREGNEYTWSDEAGDYVRQVGGPGGGRTIRLSEVEKAEIEQPQTEQVDAGSAQHGTNIVSAVGEPKNEQADLPPKRKNIGINSFGRYAPTSRDVEDFLRLGKSALEGKSAAVAKGIKRYLQGAGVIDSGLGLTPLGQMLKEDRLRAAPYALINLVYNDPQIRWFYERYGDGEYHQFEEVYHDLVDAGYSKNVSKELVAGYKKFVADPALDVFPVGRLVDKKTFQIESTAPFVSPEHVVYALHSFSDKFVNDFPYFNLSKLNKHPLSPFNVFQADKENAKSLLFGASAKYPNLISASFTHGLEKIGLGHEDIDVADVFRELTSDTETEKADETTKELEEPDAQFDDSGLGLPGKSDAALKPDVTENKDAAYFIRRDLEAPPKGTADGRQLQNNQHIQDDNGRPKENRGGESSKTQDVSQAARHTTEPLPELKGSKSQAEQANKIRDRVYNWALYTSYFDNGSWMEYNKDFYDLVRKNSDLYADEALRRFFSENDSARFWIDNEKGIRSVLYLYLRRAVPNILKEGWRPTQENREDVDRRRREAKKLLDTKWDDPNTYRKKALPQFEEAKKVRRVAEQASGIDSREDALKTAKQLKSLAYYAATKGDVETVTICRDVVASLNKKFGQGEYDQLQEWEEMLGRTHTRASNNAEKKRVKEEREKKRTAKKPVKKERGSSDVGSVSASSPRDEAELNDAASLVRRDLGETSKKEVKDDVREVAQVPETSSSKYPKRDDDAALELKVGESLAQGEPLRKKATRLRTKAKEAALKGRKEEAAELRKQADEIEAEARKYIDEATNAGVELKNRRAKALPSSEERPAEETRATVSTKQLSPNEKTEEIPYWRSYMLRFEKEARTVPEGMAYSVIGSLWNGGMALNARGDFKFATRARDALVGLSKRLAGDNASVARRRANALSESIERAKRYREKYGQPLLSPTQSPQSAIKNPAENSVQAQPVVSEQQTNSVSEPTQEQPAKPRPERWTPLKSKMNDDDRRVIENTRKRLNFGLADFAWRIADAKEKKDWQKAKELTVLAAQRYLEQARRAYRSHGGADALAAFDETLSGEALTVGQVRDRVVDKFRQLALMKVADLYKYAGERLDEWEAFSKNVDLPVSKNSIALNHLLDAQHRAPNAVPYTPPEKGKIYEVPIDSLNLDPSRFQFKLNTNTQGVTDDLEGAEFDPMQAGIIHVWRDPDDGKDYVVNGHHRFNLAKNSGYDGKVNVRYIDADTADDAKAFGAVANIADSKGSATDVAEFIRTRGSDDIRTPAGKKIATKNKLLADGRVLSKLDDTIFRKLKNGSIDEKTARIIAAELPDDKEKQLRLFSDIERLGLDASQAQDRAWAYASIQGEKQQGSLFGDDAPMEYDVESRSKLIGEIRKALGGAKRAAQAGGSSRKNEYWESQKLATNFDRDRAKQLSKSAGQTLDFFKDHIRLTGPMQNIIKEETDEYRKAIKSGKGAEKVVERAIERIKDVAQGGDGSVRRVEGLGLEYEDRLPSAKSEQTGQGVEAKGGREKQKTPRTPSESLRNGTTGEVFEAGGTDRPSDGGNGRDYASVIAEEAKKSDIPESRVREELSLFTNKGSEKTSPSSASSPENMADWERELEEMREFKFLEDPILARSNKRGSNPNAAQNAKATKAPPVASSGDKTGTSTQAPGKGVSQTPSFTHTPTIQQRIDAYVAEQRAKGRNIESLTAEDYAKIFPDEGQRTNEGQTAVSKNKRGRPRIMRPDADNTKKASKKKRKS